MSNKTTAKIIDYAPRVPTSKETIELLKHGCKVYSEGLSVAVAGGRAIGRSIPTGYLGLEFNDVEFDRVLNKIDKVLPKCQHRAERYDVGRESIQSSKNMHYAITGYVPDSSLKALTQRLNRLQWVKICDPERADLLITGNQPSKSAIASNNGLTVSFTSLVDIVGSDAFATRMRKIRKLLLKKII